MLNMIKFMSEYIEKDTETVVSCISAKESLNVPGATRVILSTLWSYERSSDLEVIIQ